MLKYFNFLIKTIFFHMTNIYTGSGSIYPSTDLLQYQLNPPNTVTRKVGEGEATIDLSSEVYEDLGGRAAVIIDGESVLKQSEFLELKQDGSPEAKAATANYIFKKMETAFQSSHLAVQGANLMWQALDGQILTQVLKAKNMANGDEENLQLRDGISKVKSAVILTKEKNCFKFTNEQLIKRFAPLPNGDLQEDYFKIKTTIHGSLDALENKRWQEMKLEVAYTKERPTKDQSLKDNYTGTRAGGLFNRHSYITA
jgi:hypothetical protein